MLLVLLATVLPLLAYIFAGFAPQARSTNEKDYVVSGRSVGKNDYANTTVGYALQMAAMFLFASWGIMYGIGALWAAVFWGLGYLLLYFMLPRFLPYIEGSSEPITLHEFLRQKFAAGRSLQLVAALATILGLMGTMLAEVDYVVQVYTPVSEQIPLAKPILLQVIFLVLGLSYIIWNGFKAEVYAERIQVPVAYTFLIFLLLALLPRVWQHTGSTAFWSVAAAMGLTLVALIVAKLDWGESGRGARFTDKQIVIPIVGLVALAACCYWTVITLPAGSGASVFSTPIGQQISAQGAVGVFSLFIANAFWMPVDLSTWQRVASVDTTNALRSLRRGTLRVALESPASWVLGAVLGWCIQGGGFLKDGADPFSAVPLFSSQLFSSDWVIGALRVPKLMYAVFLVACLAVMLSTINSIMSAIGYTFKRDLLGARTNDLWLLRISTTAALLLGFVIFEIVRRLLGANLGTLLYGAYACQLALLVIAESHRT